MRLIGSNSPSLHETFTVNDPNASTFQLDSNAGGDTAIIEGTNSSTTNNINMGAGAATVTVSSDGSATGNLDGILGTLNINEGSGLGKTLNLIDYDSAIGRSATVSGTAVAGFAPATINYKAVGGTFSNITLSGSNTVSDSFTVTANSPALNLEANGGGDAFILENNATVKSIAGGSGSDTLTYGSGYTNAVSVTLAGSNANGFSSSSATGISGSGFTGIDVLNGAGSSTLTGENAASTWTVNATPSYNDGSNTLAFSGFTTLDAGTGGDTFNVSGGASGYTLNGNTGSDTLTGVSNAVLSAFHRQRFQWHGGQQHRLQRHRHAGRQRLADRRERRQHLDGQRHPELQRRQPHAGVLGLHHARRQAPAATPSTCPAAPRATPSTATPAATP